VRGWQGKTGTKGKKDFAEERHNFVSQGGKKEKEMGQRGEGRPVNFGDWHQHVSPSWRGRTGSMKGKEKFGRGERRGGALQSAQERQRGRTARNSPSKCPSMKKIFEEEGNLRRKSCKKNKRALRGGPFFILQKQIHRRVDKTSRLTMKKEAGGKNLLLLREGGKREKTRKRPLEAPEKEEVTHTIRGKGT